MTSYRGSTRERINRIAHASVAAAVAMSAVVVGVAKQPVLAVGPTISQQIAVPSYIHPNASPEDWFRLSNSSPGAVGIAVANVINGPDYTPASEWTSVIHATHANGVKVVGYVDTGYLGTTGQRTRLGSSDMEDWFSQIQRDVAKWYEFYGDDLSGIFFDQGQNACGPAPGSNAWADRYRDLSDDVKRNHPGAITILNPGIIVPQCYENTADVLVTFEGSYETYVSGPSAPYLYAPLSWDPVDPRKIWHIVYGASSLEQLSTVMTLSRQRGAGYIYVTDDVLANPYDTLPSGDYWTMQQALAVELPVGTLVPPSAPRVLDSVEHYATMIDFDWVASTSLTSSVVAYDFYRDGLYVGSVPATSTTFRAVGLTPLTSYAFTVVARDALGLVSSPSNTREETSDETHGYPPNPPKNVYVDATGFTSTTLHWEPGWRPRVSEKPPVESFVVLQNNRPILRLPSTAQRVSIGGLAPGSEYVFSVVSVDETGDPSQPSSPVFATTDTPPVGQLIGAHSVTQTSESLTYRAEYLVPFAFRRVFIATDTAGAPCWFTGSEPQMCADYAIENDRLLRYVGTGADWQWEIVRAVAPVVEGLHFSWSISPSDIGAPVAAVFNASGYAPNSYCGEGFACSSVGPPLPYE